MTDTPDTRPVVLIAEDESDMREALVTALEAMGNFEVIAVEDGEAAVTKALEDKPNFVLLDIRMPKLNGDKVLEQIRADEPWGKKVPVTILTAQSDLVAVSNAIEIGGVNTGYLIKSDVSLAQVVEHVRSRLQAS